VSLRVGLAFGDAAGDVVAGCRVVVSSVQRDRVQRTVELAVAAAAEAVPLAARSWLSASRRTSTALRRATSRSRSASRRSPARGSASVSLARAARAVLVASRASSLPRSSPLAARRAAQLEHDLAAPGEVPDEAGAIAAGALDRPRAPSRCVPVSDAKQLAVAARVRGCGRPSDDGASRGGDNRQEADARPAPPRTHGQIIPKAHTKWPVT